MSSVVALRQPADAAADVAVSVGERPAATVEAAPALRVVTRDLDGAAAHRAPRRLSGGSVGLSGLPHRAFQRSHEVDHALFGW